MSLLKGYTNLMLYSILEISLLVAVTPSCQLKSDQATFVLFYRDSVEKHTFFLIQKYHPFQKDPEKNKKAFLK